ncbi:MAG: site-specific integrase [gamma proteobacterium symbiont of Taylorina sp.]|nr:site-specific integrase [gamma proteobacterium symbiont of Taylorina sp.]
MASIKKINRVKGAVYKVTIRQNGNGTICKTFPTKKTAVEFARTVEGDSKLQQALGNPVTRAITLSILIEEYLDQYNGKDHGIYGCLSWWSNQFGNIPLNKISVVTIREGIKLLINGNAIRGNGPGKIKEMNRKRSGSTVNRYKANLSSVFEYGKEQYGLTENPCRDVKSKPENKGRTRFLSDDERKALLHSCKKSEWSKMYLLCLMALTTGARQSELLHLKMQDIDFKKRIAHLHMTKNGEQRLLPLTNEVIELIQPKNEKVVSIAKSDKTELLFPSKKKPKQPFEFRKHWKKALIDADITDFRFHDLRHSAASFLASHGATLQEIAEVLGHKSIQMTMRYSHLCVDHKQNLIDRVMGGLANG